MPTFNSTFFWSQKMFKNYFAFILFWLQRTLTFWAKMLSKCKISFIKNKFIQTFLSCFAVDMNEAKQTNPFAYSCFDEFFTRELKQGVRPIDPQPNCLVNPVDGVIVDYGSFTSTQPIVAKHHQYQPSTLLAKNQELLATFKEATYTTYYLAPHNYHRVHMPISGKLIKTIYVPGFLYSVNPKKVAKMPNIFAKNERLICVFETPIGTIAVIMIGACLVGSMSTAWGRQYQPAFRQKTITEDFQDTNIQLKKGEEMGRFHYGSSVIMIHHSETNSNLMHPEQSPKKCQLGEVIWQFEMEPA